jgi:hypothetical protein
MKWDFKDKRFDAKGLIRPQHMASAKTEEKGSVLI